MIKIRVARNNGNEITGFDITGHAYMARSGQDIVCAAVSVLAQTAVFGLERHLNREINLTISNGKLIFSLIDVPDQLTEAILETALLGFTEIAGKYPNRVCIFETGGDL